MAGSFRDPSGYVFLRGEKVFRAIDENCAEALRDLSRRGTLRSLIDSGRIVETRFVEGELAAELAGEHQPFGAFLEHERIEDISFPYEWSVSMLADAALLTLDIQLELLTQGFSLKDATAYNVQFRRGRPVFIDLSSIEKPRRLDLWFAFGQFQRHFLYPLLLARFRGWDLRSYFLGNLDGVAPGRVAANFPGLSRWSPKLLLDVTLPLLFESKQKSERGPSWAEQTERQPGNPGVQVANLKRLRGKVRALAAGYRVGGAWHDYTSTCNYNPSAEVNKKQLITEFLRETAPRTVLDVGCNTGDYSYLAAQAGARVVAVDADHDVVELLYRRLRSEPAPILPGVLDLANPSPAIGFMNAERASFLERSDADSVFALALIHHLLVSANLSLTAICDLFAQLVKRHLVLEFVPPTDPQFQRLIKFRENLFGTVSVNACLEVFRDKFLLLDRKPIAGSERELLFFKRTS